MLMQPILMICLFCFCLFFFIGCFAIVTEANAVVDLPAVVVTVASSEPVEAAFLLVFFEFDSFEFEGLISVGFVAVASAVLE